MKVGAILEQVGISEKTYHALRRNEAISFMPRRQRWHGGFSREELLALKAFALLRSYGLNSRVAGEAVEAAFPAMKTLADGDEISSEMSYKVGVRIEAARGKLALTRLNAPQSDNAVEVGRIELDLRGIYALLPLSAAIPGVES